MLMCKAFLPLVRGTSLGRVINRVGLCGCGSGRPRRHKVDEARYAGRTRNRLDEIRHRITRPPPSGSRTCRRRPWRRPPGNRAARDDGAAGPRAGRPVPQRDGHAGDDISTQPFFWSSFNISPQRISTEDGRGSSRQPDFAISDEIAGVNMYLAPGAIRELHWHQTAEWAIMTRGKCRVTTIDPEGRPSVEDVEGRPLVFPGRAAALLQGLAPTARSSSSPSTTASSPRATRCS